VAITDTVKRGGKGVEKVSWISTIGGFNYIDELQYAFVSTGYIYFLNK
jgi:hypothetical protein